MTKLSPKAMRFIDRAVTMSKEDQIRKAWSAFDRGSGADLPDAITPTALAALKESRDRLSARLAAPLLGEDEAAELSNDLGLIRAIEADLTAQIEQAPAIEGAEQVWRFLEGLRDNLVPNYGALIAQRIAGFKHWNPDKVASLYARLDAAYESTKGKQVPLAELTVHSRWQGILGAARNRLK
jgi:hypothetical protein